jgi:hypothetical protein
MAIVPNVRVVFNVDTNSVRVEDSTVWPTISVGGSPTPYNEAFSMKGVGAFFNPSGGVVFSALNPSSPLIDLADGDTFSEEYTLPLSAGEIVNGTYSLNYSSRGSFASPTNQLEGGASGYVEIDDDNTAALVLVAGDSVVISDAAFNGTWTVVSVSYTQGSSFSRIFLSQNGVPIQGAGIDGNLAYSLSRDFVTSLKPSYTGCTKVVPSITFNSDPYKGEFGEAVVFDSTDYTGVTLVSNVILVDYPDGLIPAPSVNPIEGVNVSSVVINPLATGTYTITLQGTVLKSQTDGLSLVYTLEGIRIKGNPANVFERVVVWRDGLCCLKSCINEVSVANYNYLKQGKQSPLASIAGSLALALGQYQVALSCGIQGDIDAAYKQVENVLALGGCKCDCDCGCSNGPVWITNSSQEGGSVITQLQDEIDALQNDLTLLQTQVNEIVPSLIAASVLGRISVYEKSYGAFDTEESASFTLTSVEGDFNPYPSENANFNLEVEFFVEGGGFSISNTTTSETLVSYNAETGDSYVRLRLVAGTAGYTYEIFDHETNTGALATIANVVNTPAINLGVSANSFLIEPVDIVRILSVKAYTTFKA